MLTSFRARRQISLTPDRSSCGNDTNSQTTPFHEILRDDRHGGQEDETGAYTDAEPLSEHRLPELLGERGHEQAIRMRQHWPIKKMRKSLTRPCR